MLTRLIAVAALVILVTLSVVYVALEALLQVLPR